MYAALSSRSSYFRRSSLAEARAVEDTTQPLVHRPHPPQRLHPDLSPNLRPQSSTSGEALSFASLANGENATLSLPPPNGPGATPTGTITATLSAAAPRGVPSVPNALAYISITSTATINMTGIILATFTPPTGMSCLGRNLTLAYFAGLGWYAPAVPSPFSRYDFACSNPRSPYSISMQAGQQGLDLSADTTYAFAFY